MDDFLKYMQDYGKDMPSNVSPAVPEQPVPEMAPPAPAPQAPEMDPRMAQAMQDRDRRERMAMLLSAARQISQAGVTAAGSNVQLDDSAERMMAQRAQNPMKDAQSQIALERQQQQDQMTSEKHDAIMKEYSQKLEKGNFDITNMERTQDVGSPESQLAQEFAISINPKLNQDTVKQMSAAELYKYIPQMQQLVVANLRAQTAEASLQETRRRNDILEDKNAISREKNVDINQRFAQNLEFGKEKFDNKKDEKDQDQRGGIVKDFEKDKVVQNSNVMVSGSDNALALLNSENPVADKAVVNFMVKASGETGALTEADKRPFGGSQALTARVAQTMEEWRSGKLTPENRDFLKSLATTMKRAANRNKARRAIELVPKQSKAYKMDTKEVTDLMMPALTNFEGEDREAVEWALQNPDSPQAEKILELHGL